MPLNTGGNPSGNEARAVVTASTILSDTLYSEFLLGPIAAVVCSIRFLCMGFWLCVLSHLHSVPVSTPLAFERGRTSSLIFKAEDEDTRFDGQSACTVCPE